MKKPYLSILPILTLLFCAFTLGIFIGRNQNHETVSLSTVSAKAMHSTPAPVTIPEETQPSVIFPIDINSATAMELSALPGIGTELAQRIIAYRDICGAFPAPEELLNVDGIGPGKLEAILDYVTTGG